MHALFLDNGSLSYRDDHPRPSVAIGEALIRPIYAGICSTDLELVRGYADFRGVPGHEFVGIVEKASSQDWIGRRVVGEINLGCGSCRTCRGQGSSHCPNRTVLGIIGKNGAFADLLTLPEGNLHSVPEDIDDKSAVFVEPLAAALRIHDQITVPPSEAIAVIGPGKLGLLIGQVLALTGSKVVMLGRRRESLDLAELLGLEADRAERAKDSSISYVVEATGNKLGLENALRICKPLGTLVMKSTYSGSADIDLTKLVVGEINVIGSRCGPFEPALRLLSRRLIKVKELIEAEYTLAEGTAAFKHASRPGARKILLRP